jgi:hypothetical protein
MLLTLIFYRSDEFWPPTPLREPSPPPSQAPSSYQSPRESHARNTKADAVCPCKQIGTNRVRICALTMCCNASPHHTQSASRVFRSCQEGLRRPPGGGGDTLHAVGLERSDFQIMGRRWVWRALCHRLRWSSILQSVVRSVRLTPHTGHRRHFATHRSFGVLGLASSGDGICHQLFCSHIANGAVYELIGKGRRWYGC